MNTIERSIDSLDWMTLVLLLGLTLLAIGKYLYQTRFMSFLILPFNNKYISMYSKKGRLLNWFHILMTLFQIINFSLFLYFAFQIFELSFLNKSTAAYFIILPMVVLVLLLKIVLQMSKGYVFNTQALVNEIIYNKLSYFNHSGLIMFIANIVLIYILKDSKPIVYGTIFLILFINIIGLINILKNRQKMIVTNVFYFILYLCTLEIAPLVIIGGYLKD